MKYIVKSIAVLVLSVASISALAKDKPMNMQPGNASGQGMAMEMSDEMKDKMARKKQIYILKMNDLSDRIQDEKNAKKKQALMDEQLQLIKDHQEKKAPNENEDDAKTSSENDAKKGQYENVKKSYPINCQR